MERIVGLNDEDKARVRQALHEAIEAAADDTGDVDISRGIETFLRAMNLDDLADAVKEQTP